ncbi:hypothetical protein L6R52_32900, partial [Myxococcota bacterium]|nr:hypothetical protein [Myxococcota bacterium]
MSFVALAALTVAVGSTALGARRVMRALAGPLGLGPLAPGALAVGLAISIFLVSIALVGRPA